MKTHRLVLAASSSAFAIAAMLSAAQAQEIINLDEIRVESQDAQDALGNTAISQKDLKERNAETIADVFAGESEVKASGGPAIAQKVFVHGIEESLLAVTIDGARQNKSAFHHTGNVLIDPALLKRVEVSSGLAPADAGPGALAGLLAYETKSARDLLDEGATFGGTASLSYNSNGGTFRRSVSFYGINGGFEYLLNATRTSGDDYKDGSGTTILGTGAKVDAYMAKVAYTTDTGKRLEFTVDHARDSGLRPMQLGPGGLYYARPDFAGVVGRPSVYLPALSERQSYTFTYKDERPDGGFSPTIQLSYNKQLIEAGAAIGTNTSLSGKVENRFDIGGGVLTAGIDFFHDTARGHGLLNAAGAKETLRNIGVYAQMRHDVSDRVSLSYGGRFDVQQFTLADGSKHEASGASVNASADFILTDTLTLNAGIASSWGGFELSEASLINLGGAWVYGTPSAARANNARVGLRYDNGPWQIKGAVFYTEINDIDNILGAARAKSDLVSQGFDASLRYTGGRGYAQLNWTYADVREAGAPVSSTGYYYGRPVGHIIGLSGAFELNDQWTLGGNAEIALENKFTSGSDLPGYEVVNVFATYKPRNFDNLEIRFDVRNVFDEQYAKRTADGIDNPARIISLTEPGRSFALTASMRF